MYNDNIASIITYKVVNSIIWFDFAHFNKTFGQCGHHMLHEVVTERDGLGLKHFLFLSFHKG